MALAALWLGALAMPAAAQSVALAGTMGQKALLVIDGQARTLAVGETAHGVTLIQLMADGSAQVRQGGQSSSLRVGAAPVSLAAAARTSQKSEIVLPVGPGGHFMAQGAINGRAVQFMVDTGATSISLSEDEAKRIGLDFQNGERGVSSTANGPVAVHNVTLSAVRVGSVEVANVRAVVVPAAMPYILLGNSFLSRFSMRRDSDVMRLELRP